MNRCFNIQRKMTAAIAGVCMLFAIAGAFEGKKAEAYAEKNKSIILHDIEQVKELNAGDHIVFGTYEQDNDMSDGKENIEWIVLDKEGDRALIVSEYALDAKPCHNDQNEVTWKTCALRDWLNNEFLNEAFSEDEQLMISTDAPDGDRVTLLSIKDVHSYFPTDEARRCAPTPYAKAKGISVNEDYIAESGGASCWWWLKLPGSSHYTAAFVVNAGYVYCGGDYVRYDSEAVRPALWIG